MQPKRRLPRRRSLLFFALFFSAALALVATAGESASRGPQAKNDESYPPNLGPGELWATTPGRDCLGCHRVGSWNPPMTDSVVVFPIVPVQYRVGDDAVLPVQIINPWLSELRNVTVNVTLLGAPILAIRGDQAASIARDYSLYEEKNVGPVRDALTDLPGDPGPSTEYRFSYTKDAAAILMRVRVRAELDGTLLGDQKTDTFRVYFNDRINSPSSGFFRPWNAKNQSDPSLREWNFTYFPPGKGDGKIFVEHTGGESRHTSVHFMVDVIAQAPAQGKTYRVPGVIPKIPKHGSEVLDIPLTTFAQGSQDMIVQVRAMNYYKHSSGQEPTSEVYSRYAVLNRSEDIRTPTAMIAARHVTVGDRYIPAAFGPVKVQADLSTDLKLVLGEVSGFASATLLIPSLILGGAYGKSSRRVLNFMLGGAKRRVMFHNLLSLGLSMTALVHILLFVLEIQYSPVVGLLWGGLGAFGLLALGLTGYYQVPLIQRHGFRWWQVVHLGFGFLVLVFVAGHTLLDGADFVELREHVPQWLRSINLST